MFDTVAGMTYRMDVIEVRMGFKLDIELYRYRYRYIDSLHLFQQNLPDLCLQEEPEVMWDPGFFQPSPCHSRTSSGSHSENGVHRSPMKVSQGSYFSTDSPSSGVIVTGPPSHHVPTNLLLSRGSTSPQVPLSPTLR